MNANPPAHTPHREPGSVIVADPLGIGSVAPLHDVRFSPWIRRVAITLLILLFVGPLLAAFSPWQQYVLGTGSVVAYGPNDRPQTVRARVDGRVTEVHVIENTMVEEGDLLVELVDVDPQKIDRLQQELAAARDDLDAQQRQEASLEEQIEQLKDARDEKVASLQAKIRAAEQKVLAAEKKLEGLQATRQYAEQELERFQNLESEGGVSGLQILRAKADLTKAQAEVLAGEADVSAAEADVDEAEANLGTGRAEAQAKITEAIVKRDAVRSKIAEVRAKIASAEGKLRAQRMQDVVAPFDGKVFRVLVNPNSDFVKKGDPLIQIVPEAAQRAVQIFVNGNDASLIQPGRKVRVQFEGWPAVQFVGWPSVAVGTFGGIVDQVDATDSGNGRFRLLIVPDPTEPDWPGSRWLRQGVRAKGWVLLNQVPLWYEVWRQLNGFPPVISQSEPKTGDDPAQVKRK